MSTRKFFRILLLAAGIFMLTSSSGMARQVQEPEAVSVQLQLPIVLKQFAFGNGTVTGTVINASKPDYVVPGAQVCWKTNCVFSSVPAGIYRIENVASGPQTLTASLDGFVTIDQIINVVGNTDNNQDIAIIPEVGLSGVEYRILTTWDVRPCWPDPNGIDCWPNDLDAHLWLEPPPMNYHIGYYFHYNPYADPPGEEYWTDRGDCLGYPNACLERDERYGYGPETIAIKQAEIMMYYFGVFNSSQGYPGVPPLSHTAAKVRLYSEDGLLKTYNVPVGGGDYKFWYVFSINGETGEITDQNCIIDYSNNPPQCP
jgi:hypothetical protein